jgi:hypothetical protein
MPEEVNPKYALGYGEVPEIMLFGPSQVLNFRASDNMQYKSPTRTIEIHFVPERNIRS